MQQFCTSVHVVLRSLKKRPVLVVAIDEAQCLLDVKNSTGIDALQMLRPALKRVNNSETARAANGVVFVVPLDSDGQYIQAE